MVAVLRNAGIVPKALYLTKADRAAFAEVAPNVYEFDGVPIKIIDDASGSGVWIGI